MSILRGLIGTEAYANMRFTNVRRKVFYKYPAGAAPLLGLLSVINTDKPLYDPEFTIFEKRMRQRSTTTAEKDSSHGPWANAAGVVIASGSGFALSSSTEYQLTVAATEAFRATNTILINKTTQYGVSTVVNVRALITEIVSATVLKIRPLDTYTNISNEDDANLGLFVLAIGSAYRQGSGGATESGYQLPVSVSNVAQIFKTATSFTGTELQTSVKFDEEGIYKDRMQETALEHMTDIEWALMFGTYSKSIDTASGLPLYTTRGILDYLSLWEAGTTYGNTAATVNSDDNKRIINVNGDLSRKTLETYLERVFRVTNNVAQEKLAFCGNGFLGVLNQMVRKETMTMVDMPIKTSMFGQDIYGVKCPYGTVYFKTHPLFNLYPQLSNNALFLDVSNISYRPVANRDTKVKKNTQPNDADYRKDEYLTEAGFEIKFPESCMYLTDVTGYAAS